MRYHFGQNEILNSVSGQSLITVYVKYPEMTFIGVLFNCSPFARN